MTNLWEDVIKWLEDASKVIGKEAGDLTQKGRLKIEIFELKRKLRDSFAELGSMIYGEVFVKKNERWKVNLKVKAVIKKIQNTQRQLKIKTKECEKVGGQK